MAPPTVAPLDRIAFLDALRASELLSPALFAKAKTVAPTGSAAQTADALVAAGLLTRFQADRLLAGRAEGFLLGPYVVLEQVGRGSMSRVYKAKHRTMHRTVALKVLSAELTDTPARREAVRAAVRAAGKLAHPNIVTAYDANELLDRFYLVLEYVDGPDLGALVARHGPLPVVEACEFVRQIAAGLEHAHEKGMIHRDIKPANLLVSRPTPSTPPTVKIADFGLPKAAASGDFAAPELFGPAPTALIRSIPTGSSIGAGPAPRADVRSDLYSLGRVFHFLLSGRSGREPLPIVQLRPDVPPEVSVIVHRLLAKNPNERYASAPELLFHLSTACVPTAIPVEGGVNFDLPMPPIQLGRDSDYLGNRHPPHPVADTSPWAEITAASEPAPDTVPVARDQTPTPVPRKAKPGRGAPVPVWMTAALLGGIVGLCLVGIALAVKVLAK